MAANNEIGAASIEKIGKVCKEKACCSTPTQCKPWRVPVDVQKWHRPLSLSGWLRTEGRGRTVCRKKDLAANR